MSQHDVSTWTKAEVMEWVKTVHGGAYEGFASFFATIDGRQLVQLDRNDLMDFVEDRPAGIMLHKGLVAAMNATNAAEPAPAPPAEGVEAAPVEAAAAALPANVVKAVVDVRDALGLTSWNPGQLQVLRLPVVCFVLNTHPQVIVNVLKKRHTFAWLPTGGGKSLTYIIPTMIHCACVLICQVILCPYLTN